MHIPDGYLDPVSAGVTWTIMVGYGAYAYKHTELGRYIETVVGLAAAIFIAQMFNWPIPGGTSLHLVGGALAAIMLGPFNAFFVLLLVLVVQALVFHDGGITTLGANVINMGIVAPLVGYFVYKALKRYNRFAAAFVAGWASITVAGFFAGLEIGLSPWFPYGWEISVPVMTSWHALLGLVEGMITAVVVEYLARKAPQYLRA
ncbi:energy-coupling factor ABC transporter permease [Thermoproteus tenax]|uniref:Cobalt ABC transporter, permease protein (N-terminus) n=1 Tax=Thermoproteus tenax (strain ATCC 35583 / DSM 2078 / JCM 9277 / NBRC 100435 / Kra 1) TaxID=768679 RepID=G4RMT2_THETK|nr:energy-coupling factor ABC transporter permease [Thermoproteus tenax]CCC80876.1 cobalt ABC transporter, permease protein (N-terminus) [Thermoproteus tenax Kra 1]